jgi:hypothetical protein
VEEAEEYGRVLSQKYGINYRKVSAKTGEGMDDFVRNLAIKVDGTYKINSDLDPDASTDRVVIGDKGP